jgi:hypothetical protein
MRLNRLAPIFVSGVAIAAVLGYVAGRVRAAGIPTMSPVMTYSGTLTDSGTPVTGMRNIQVQLWDQASGGTAAVCGTQSTAVQVDGGNFQVPLPDACVTAVHASGDLWAEVVVNGASLGRSKIGAVPYAVEAQHAAPVSAMRASSSVAQMVAPSYAATTLLFGTVQFDLAGEYVKETGVFTAKEDGYFSVTCQMHITGAPAQADMGVSVVVNDVAVATQGLIIVSFGGAPLATTLTQLHVGDKVRCDGYQGTSAPLALSGKPEINVFSVARLY